MNYRDPELIETLAAEYALGTLQGRARRRFEALRQEREDIDRETGWWENALAGWALRLPPVTPPTRVWQRISRQLDSERAHGRERPGHSWLAVAASVLVVGLVGIFLLRPAELPPEPAVEQVAVIQDEEHAPMWRIQVRDRHLDVRHIAASEPGEDRDYELWLLTDAGPVSLGLLPESGERRLDLPDELSRRMEAGASIAVSVEPAGGSPESTPTGPVIAVAPLVKA